jgi:class 3 adenylate cyclase/HAMP domain-containing protein
MTERSGSVAINIERRIGTFTLLAIWLAVFVIPVLILQLSLDFLFKQTRQANLRAMTAKMTNEMDRFRNDLEMESFLQRSCEVFFADPASQNINDPAKLAESMRDKTGVPAAGVITHSADTQSVDYWFNEELGRSLSNISRTLTRRWFVSVNEQQLYGFHSSAAAESIQALFRFSNPLKAKKDADLFFRRMFALIAEVPVVPFRVSRSVSAKPGGSIYFYYHPFKATQAGVSRITGGCLLVVNGRDIAWQKVARAAVKRFIPGLQRSFVRFSDSLWEQKHSLQKPITRFVEDDQGYHLQSTMSRSSMVDLVHGGTFVPARLQEIASRLPLLEISVAESQLQHPLFAYRSHISFAGRLFILAGTLLLVNLYLFGFEFKAGITSKSIVATAFLLVLPFLLLFAGFVSWNQFNQVIGRYRLESRQQQLFTDFTEGLASYLLDLQHANYDLALKIEGRLEAGKDDEISAIFAGCFEESPALAELRLDRKFLDGLYMSSPHFSNNRSNIDESSMRLFAATIMHGFNEQGILTGVSSTGEEESVTAMDSTFINEVVNRCGGIYQFAAFGSDRRFSSIYFNYPGKNSIRAILTASFDRDILLGEFANRHFKGVSDLRHQFFIQREDFGIPRFYDLSDNSEVADPILLEHLKLASISGHNLYEPEKNHLAQIFSMADMPLFMLTQAEIAAGQLITPGYMMLLPLYGLTLMFLILLVFKLIYLRPIAEFVRVTECVAAGDYQQRVALTGSDEFGELKSAFDEMIKGLEQRRRLSHFLSSEAMRAVEEDADDSMAPGGIRIEASVAFVRLHDLHDQAGDQVFKALGVFIDEANRAVMPRGGVVDKLIEDTLMLVFRSSQDLPDHALAAASAILDLVEAMRQRSFHLRGGIASGSVVSGRIGSRLGKLDFTVIGDAVNLAARLKAEAHRTTQTGIIVAPSTIRLLRGRARVSFLARTEIKGKSREYPLYELTALRQN